MLAQRLSAGVKFVAERTLVIFSLHRRVSGVFLLVHGEIGFSGVALQTHVTLKRLFSGVHSRVTLIFSCDMKSTEQLMKPEHVYI